MILKASQRANGADLAIHLMNACDNERIEVAEVFGTVADDLFGAFAEFEFVARGTRAKQPLYSLSISPPGTLTREQYFEAIEAIEHRLGLTAQPRAVVFHVKDGREHCHVIWSRIDTEKMRAIHMSHDHAKLMDLACDLARKFGFELTAGMRAWEEKRRQQKAELEPTLAENAQEIATGITPEERRDAITAAFESSDSAEAFIHALEERGYILARGDRRGFVVVDEAGNVRSLSRYVKGHSAKDVRAKLAPLTPEQLPSVDQAKELMRQRVQAQQDREREQGAEDDKQRRAQARRDQEEAGLTRKQRDRRAQLAGREQDLRVRHAGEKLSLHAAQKTESESLLFRLRRAVADFIDRTPGLRSVLGPIQKMAGLDPADRHRLEREALARRHAREQKDIERHKRMLARLETRERKALERRLAKAEGQDRAAAMKAEHERRQADENAAREHTRQEAIIDDRRREFEWGDLADGFNRNTEDDADLELEAGALSDAFNANAGADETPPSGTGEDGDDDGPRHRPQGPSRRRRHRRGYGYRRDD